MADATLAEALEVVRHADPSGVLRPEAVVEAARPAASPLHGWFEWDNGKAAHEHRLAQARRLINATVTVLGREEQEVRAYVSLTNERGEGYRATQDVMRKAPLRAQLLADALAELKRVQNRYAGLKELAQVFDAVRAVDVRVNGNGKTNKKKAKVAT